MGNIYDRSWSESYTSDIFSWEEPRNKLGLQAIVEENEGGYIDFFFRSGSTIDQLVNQEWKLLSADKANISPEDRHLQYKVVFYSNNGDYYPKLLSVSVKLE